ncbi:MAG: 50S ribosomal protein L25, partial [Armatimonadetes bacterium]|nr:50S ribosomal protein L25 [Armatimonadota bacterium]
QPVSEVTVKALPDKIPSHIDVDISHLELGDAVHVGDLQIPEGVEILAPPAESMIVSVKLPHVRVEEVAPVEEAEEGAEPAEGAEEAPAAEAEQSE